ncbi:MAG: trypsin-like peptidase domain-containing protein [Clostridia bacterium]|nr:trypsin-like peptidase domain-containing protein [Clostridia bacterium]
MMNKENNPFDNENQNNNERFDFDQLNDNQEATGVSWCSKKSEDTEEVSDEPFRDESAQPESPDNWYYMPGQPDSGGDQDFEFSAATEYEPETVIPKKKSRIGKVVLAVMLCVSLFAGATLGTALPGMLENNADSGAEPGRNTVKILHNKANDGAQKTAANKLTETGEKSTQEIAAAVGPAVVGIENMGRGGYYGMYGSSEVTMGTGSGVVMTEDGYIITNYHVVEGATKVKVVTSSGETYDAKIIGVDEDSDLAVIKVEAKGLTHVTFGDSSAVTVGDKAIAIGNPLGTELMGTVTQGIISAVNRTVQIDNKAMTLLQTDAAINSGNSGGALINAYGEVIGINSAKMAASGVEGLGFAIPSNTVLEVVQDLIDYGYVKGKLTIGIAGTNITAKMASYYELPMGFYVQEVYPGTGAANAGIKPGDIIIKCDGKVVQNIDDINDLKKKHKEGDIMVMEIVRNENKITVKVVLQEEKPETAW